MSTQRTLVTSEDLLDISARISVPWLRCELVRGEVIEMALAGGVHGKIANTISFILTSFVRERELGIVFAAETGFILRRDPDTVRAPDVAFVSKERLPEDELPSGYVDVVPDFVVEVVSPNDSASYVQGKVEDWLRAGVRLVWAVFPQTRSVAAYRSLQEGRVLSEGDTLDAHPGFDDFYVSVKELFSSR